MLFDPPLPEHYTVEDVQRDCTGTYRVDIGHTIRIRRKCYFMPQPSAQRWLLLKLRIKHKRPMTDKDWWEYVAGPQGCFVFGMLMEPPPTLHTRIA
jgi:hypothetical protein